MSSRRMTPAVAADSPPRSLELGLALVAGEVAQHGAQVRQVDERQPVRVGVVEHQPEARLLRLVEPEHLAQQQRPEPATRSRARALPVPMPPSAKYSVTDAVGLPVLPDSACARQQLLVRLARRRDAGEVALDVGGEHRDALGRELLGEPLQRAGLAGAGRAGDEPVPVHHAERDADLRLRHRVAVHERAEVERRRLERVAGDDRPRPASASSGPAAPALGRLR